MKLQIDLRLCGVERRGISENLCCIELAKPISA